MPVYLRLTVILMISIVIDPQFFLLKKINFGGVGFLCVGYFLIIHSTNFLDKGIVDEESLKAYARIHITTHLMDKGHPQYDYFKSIIAEEPDAIDHFYSNFSERIKNGLRQAGVESREELIELVRQTGLVGVHQIGKKSKDEILTYLGMENTYAIIESNGDYKID